MKDYILRISFEKEPKCSECTLAIYQTKTSELLDEEIYTCVGLEEQPRCAVDGRLDNCPLQPIWQN